MFSNLLAEQVDVSAEQDLLAVTQEDFGLRALIDLLQNEVLDLIELFKLLVFA
jgi:hypothetical protein